MEACLILDAGVLLLLENFGLWILFRLIDVTKVQQFTPISEFLQIPTDLKNK